MSFWSDIGDSLSNFGDSIVKTITPIIPGIIGGLVGTLTGAPAVGAIVGTALGGTSTAVAPKIQVAATPMAQSTTAAKTSIPVVTKTGGTGIPAFGELIKNPAVLIGGAVIAFLLLR